MRRRRESSPVPSVPSILRDLVLDPRLRLTVSHIFLPVAEWIPAFAGMTGNYVVRRSVIPAKAGIQKPSNFDHLGTCDQLLGIRGNPVGWGCESAGFPHSRIRLTVSHIFLPLAEWIPAFAS